MYPSGQWEGFWFQEAFGKQKMTAFTLRFANGEIGGTWNVEDVLTGPFLLKPVLQRPTSDEPIDEVE